MQKKKILKIVIIFPPAESKTIKNGKAVHFDSDRLDEEKESGQSFLDNPSTSSDTIFLGDDIPSTSRKNSSKIVDDPALHVHLEKYDKLINRQHHEGVIRKEYNYTVSDFNLTYDDLEEQLTLISTQMKTMLLN